LETHLARIAAPRGTATTTTSVAWISSSTTEEVLLPYIEDSATPEA
jgi:hypothetical protein